MLESSSLSSCFSSPMVMQLQQVCQIFWNLKTSSRRRIYFCPDYPNISEDRFNKCDWEDFHRDAKEDVMLDMPESLERAVETYAFLNASHDVEK